MKSAVRDTRWPSRSTVMPGTPVHAIRNQNLKLGAGRQGGGGKKAKWDGEAGKAVTRLWMHTYLHKTLSALRISPLGHTPLFCNPIGAFGQAVIYAPDEGGYGTDFFQPASERYFAYIFPIAPMPISPIVGWSAVGELGDTSDLNIVDI